MIVPRAHREDFGELYQPLIRNLIARQIELFQADGRALDLDHQRQQGRDLSPQLASCTETSDGESRSTAERPCSPACAAAGVAEVSTMRRSERRCSVGWPAMPAQSCCNHSALTYDLPSPISRAVAPFECLNRAANATIASNECSSALEIRNTPCGVAISGDQW